MMGGPGTELSLTAPGVNLGARCDSGPASWCLLPFLKFRLEGSQLQNSNFKKRSLILRCVSFMGLNSKQIINWQVTSDNKGKMKSLFENDLKCF